MLKSLVTPLNSTKLPSIELLMFAVFILVLVWIIELVIIEFSMYDFSPTDTNGPTTELQISTFSPIKQGGIIMEFLIFAEIMNIYHFAAPLLIIALIIQVGYTMKLVSILFGETINFANAPKFNGNPILRD